MTGALGTPQELCIASALLAPNSTSYEQRFVKAAGATTIDT